MALVCSHCGKTLPKDDARFCANCGKPVLPPSSHSQSGSLTKKASPTVQAERSKLREQVAHLPPAHPTPANNAPVSNAPEQAEVVQSSEPSVAQSTFRQPEEQPSPTPELHVRIWDEADPLPDATDDAAGAERESQEDIEELPTRPEILAQNLELDELPTLPELAAMGTKGVSEIEDIEDEDEEHTQPAMPAISLKHTSVHDARMPNQETPEPLPGKLPEPQPVATPVTFQLLQREREAIPQPARSLAHAFAGASMIQSVWQRARRSYTAVEEHPMFAAHRRKLPYVLVVALLIVLIGAGVLTWIVAYQPFSVATITNPQQSFSDPQLGISLQYPNGWDQQVDTAKSAIHFYDNRVSRTTQIAIVLTGANSDVTRIVQQQASSLGMTGTKAGKPLAFAGATWQQWQGTVLQKGASYTCTILATVHGNHLYTLVQQATSDTYADAEQYFFAPLRQSLQFT